MNEREWLACKDGGRMLNFLYGVPTHRRRTPFLRTPQGIEPIPKASDRKLRLFACGWARLVGVELYNAVTRNAVEVAERFADGQASATELAAAHQPLLYDFHLAQQGR